MEAFGYANPKTLKEAFGMLGASWKTAWCWQAAPISSA